MGHVASLLTLLMILPVAFGLEKTAIGSIGNAGTKCLPGQPCFPSLSDISYFKSTLTSLLLTEGNEGYDAATDIHNARVRSRPSLILMATNDKDVIAAIQFVKTFNLLLSIKSTGHCYSGNCLLQDSFHIDLSQMNKFDINEADGVVTAQPGVNFEELYKACGASGLLAVGGMGSTVGLVGYISGGGHGPLVRSYGLGADQVIGFTIVTADGQARNVDSRQAALSPDDRDLMYGVRGGGGGTFGVITEIILKVHPSPRTISSISCHYPLLNTLGTNGTMIGRTVLSRFISTIAPQLPSQWSVYTSVTRNPIPNPFSIKNYNPLHMQGVLSFEGLYIGNETFTESVAMIAPLSSLYAEWQLECTVRRELDFVDWHSRMWFTGTPSFLPSLREYMASGFVRSHGADSDAIAAVIVNSTLQLSDLSTNAWFIVHLGGMVRENFFKFPGSTSVSSTFREADLLVEITANWLTSLQDGENIQWVKEGEEKLHACEGIRGQYLNEADPQVTTYVDDFWDSDVYSHLQSIKGRIDDSVMFDCSQCVKIISNRIVAEKRRLLRV